MKVGLFEPLMQLISVRQSKCGLLGTQNHMTKQNDHKIYA